MDTEITIQKNQSSIRKDKSKKDLFCWDEITEKDKPRFLKFLQSFGIDGLVAKIEKMDNGRTINISCEKKILSFSLNIEKTKATLKIDDFKTYDFTVKKENGKLNIYPKPKISELVDKWILPLTKYNLKFWIHSTNEVYRQPSIAIGLGTISKPGIFSFALLDDNSVQWLESTLKESLETYDKYKTSKNKAVDRLTLWERKKELDKFRKISITVSVVKKGENISINLMINANAFLYVDLYPDDIDWILTTLSTAKNSLETMLRKESK
ncbi:MAG: hypothetical protein C3F06_14880 [Candidatus Methanoperedenaceae archaeon]|nr:MAG: hypothetical protein C3F06_14880 [Candidatus Methanoperedenaceae archaeon]